MCLSMRENRSLKGSSKNDTRIVSFDGFHLTIRRDLRFLHFFISCAADKMEECEKNVVAIYRIQGDLARDIR